MPDRDSPPPTLASLRAAKRSPRGKSAPVKPSTLDLFTPQPDPEPQQPFTPQSAPSNPLARRIWSVHELVAHIRNQVESAHPSLLVEGEISNCRLAPSGHLYFTLKDGDAQLPVVLFRRQATLLRFRPQDGLAVLVKGRISVYEPRGQLQLIAETLDPLGAGALQLAFEQLKARLLAEGLFDAARKRPLPAFPRTVGVITSPTGAVIRDIVTVIRRRHAPLNLLIYPATMQGASSPASVIAGLRFFNQHPDKIDLVLLARGGGSLEDLAAFNDEPLARAIAASALPTVSAIGHETDFTIADFVADLRAPTPSAAAEIITAAQHRIEERVASLENRTRRAISYQLMHARQRYARLSATSVLLRLRDAVSRRDQHLDELHLRLDSAITRRHRVAAQRLTQLEVRLRRHDPTVRLANAQRRLQQASTRLQSLSTQTTATLRTRLNRATIHLEALSPLAVLNRGYALVYDENGKLLRTAASTATGKTITARLAKGTLTAEVKTTISE